MLEIFEPVRVKNIEFINRVVMAPMVRFGFEYNKGIFGEKLMEEYLTAADKNIGLLVSQALSVIPGKNVRGGAYSEEHIEYLAKIAKACHAGGCRFFAQLAYPGFAFYDDSARKIDSLTTEEIISIRKSFIDAARICKKAGLDGIELHGAHSYFLNMMSSPLANHRTDSYGGDIPRRLKLAEEIISGIREFAGEGFIISYRMGWLDDLDLDIKTAQNLEKIGVDMLHISKGIPSERPIAIPENFNFNEVVYTASVIKKNVRVPVIAVNEIKTISRGNELIKTGAVDFAAYGRPFLADPAFAKKSIKDEFYKPCVDCNKCKWYTKAEECPGRLCNK
ncbi:MULTISPECIES: NADH:flavin oxidoreductase [unclassified Treponema]|uniref:NADH:flavin oxidoreductase n=1 Tax=unclassified Treponema TaxID=2638727 RepID=UPI0020A34A55|nr:MULTISPECIES: NADH:flavin oxidoreductase [unclassified Treponema]UTC66683.1 NADH:flavin oxidoreductase [Treponema sp. OMZ 789]UTC69415.1 NADH:flavin oxidoreductase [Treponema sp. OMZ 790]UTC72129.1 NADH:flavin oxidoreductase [Treponema sp. OMZ 791]